MRLEGGSIYFRVVPIGYFGIGSESSGYATAVLHNLPIVDSFPGIVVWLIYRIRLYRTLQKFGVD